jgi:Fuc2NAc and GlcNAc transferase
MEYNGAVTPRDHAAYPIAVASVLVLAVVLAAWLTERIRAYAVRAGIQDVPNQRSSHEAPTPRGGGLAIVMVVCAGVVGLAVAEGRWTQFYTVLLAGGTALAIVGWLDDVRGTPVLLRLAVHGAAAVGAISAMGVVEVRFGDLFALDGWAAAVFAVVWMVWMVNSYNFMDGIDGIAGGQGVTAAGGIAAIAWSRGAHPQAEVAALLAAASLGFLLRNWPPARIFMGDVASGWIGFQLAVLALVGEASGAVPLVSFVILMGAFLVDSTMTLLRRLMAGARVHQAHRDHAYQHAVQRGYRHGTVSGVVMAINLLWLLPLALLAAEHGSWGPALLAIAWAPLVALALYFQAGRLQKPDPDSRGSRRPSGVTPD